MRTTSESLSHPETSNGSGAGGNCVVVRRGGEQPEADLGARPHVVARYFNGQNIPYTFLGASVLPLLVDNPALQEIRPTIDIDLSVQVVTLSALTVDVMPTEAAVLGMASEWFHEAVKTATKMDLGRGCMRLSSRAPVSWPQN